jgi:RNA polymerase sigma-70 factor (ECF subfamily)
MTDTAYREMEILHQLASGDSNAFAIVYKQYYQRIFYYAKTFLPDKQDAEDITADTFVKLWNRRSYFQSMPAINSFLHITARNSCLDFLRHNKVRAEKQEELIRQIELLDRSHLQQTRDELLKLVHKEVSRMSARMKQIYHLSYDEGLSPAEIARQLNISVQTVSNQKTTVIKNLKKVLGHRISLPLMLLLLESGKHIIK